MMYTWRQLQAVKPRTVWHWKRKIAICEPVVVSEQRFGYIPARFRYRGTLHQVRRTIKIWEDPGRGTMPARRYFKVDCANDVMLTLFQDLHSGTWHMAP